MPTTIKKRRRKLRAYEKYKHKQAILFDIIKKIELEIWGKNTGEFKDKNPWRSI